MEFHRYLTRHGCVIEWNLSTCLFNVFAILFIINITIEYPYSCSNTSHLHVLRACVNVPIYFSLILFQKEKKLIASDCRCKFPRMVFVFWKWRKKRIAWVIGKCRKNLLCHRNHKTDRHALNKCLLFIVIRWNCDWLNVFQYLCYFNILLIVSSLFQSK